MSKAKRLRIIHEYMPYGRILIVDDVESNLYVAKGMMLPYGLRIDTAKCGTIAVDKIKEGNVYDIIFMDHMMPKMNGMEATKIIREMGYTNSIVALTANALAGQAEMFLNNGFDGFISKPIDSRELDLTLTQLVRDKYPKEVINAARLEKGQQKVSTDFVSENKAHISDNLKQAVIEDVDNAIAALKEMLPKINAPGADIEPFITTVHGMKSAFANIGETDLSSFASKLEQAGNNGDMDLILVETQGFINSLQSFVDKIRPEKTSVSAEPFHGDTVFLKEKLGEMKIACEKFKTGSAKKALAELKQQTWPPEISEIVDEISVCLVRGDMKKVVSITEIALNKL